jgi:hypothetical protein
MCHGHLDIAQMLFENRRILSQFIPAAVPADELTTDARSPADNYSGAIPAWVFAAAAGALAAGTFAWRIT